MVPAVTLSKTRCYLDQLQSPRGGSVVILGCCSLGQLDSCHWWVMAPGFLPFLECFSRLSLMPGPFLLAGPHSVSLRMRGWSTHLMSTYPQKAAMATVVVTTAATVHTSSAPCTS